MRSGATDDGDTAGDGTAEVTVLSADEPWVENAYDEHDRVSPDATTEPVENGEVSIALPPYSLVRVTV